MALWRRFVSVGLAILLSILRPVNLSDVFNKILSDPQSWLLAGIAIAVGIILGLLLVSIVVIRRRRQTFNSMMALEDCIGLSAVVEVPFDQTCSGKINIQLDNRTLACLAYSGEAHQFQAGDAVVIVGIKGKKVWVIPAQEFHAS